MSQTLIAGTWIYFSYYKQKGIYVGYYMDYKIIVGKKQMKILASWNNFKQNTTELHFEDSWSFGHNQISMYWTNILGNKTVNICYSEKVSD